MGNQQSGAGGGAGKVKSPNVKSHQKSKIVEKQKSSRLKASKVKKSPNVN